MGGNFARITIDGVPILIERNPSDNYRGLHIVVLNASSGEVILAKVFDTYESSQLFEEFIDSKSIDHGNIVVGACQDECANQLSAKAK